MECHRGVTVKRECGFESWTIPNRQRKIKFVRKTRRPASGFCYTKNIEYSLQYFKGKGINFSNEHSHLLNNMSNAILIRRFSVVKICDSM